MYVRVVYVHTMYNFLFGNKQRKIVETFVVFTRQLTHVLLVPIESLVCDLDETLFVLNMRYCRSR